MGLGLGFSLAQYLASKGHTIVGVDIDEQAYLKPRLDDEMKEWLVHNNRVVFYTTEFSFLRECEYIFIFVSTPLRDGRLSLDNVIAALESVSATAFEGKCIILSTLPVGGMREFHRRFPSMEMVYAPPMVKKHRFLSTFMSPPSRFQMFSRNDDSLLNLYRNLQDIRTRQFIAPEQVIEKAKLMVNLMLATKIIIANAIGNKAVCELVSHDPRVGEGYFTPGGPAQGPCLPRDLLELEAASTDTLKEIVMLLNKVNKTNELV